MVEILLACLIFSVISLGIYGTFLGSILLSRRIDETGRIYYEARLIAAQIETDIKNMLPYDYSGSYPDLRAFTGSVDGFSLILNGPHGLMFVRYSFEPVAEGRIHRVLIGSHSTQNTPLTLRNDGGLLRKYLVREEMPLLEYWQEDSQAAKEILGVYLEPEGFSVSYASAALTSSGNTVAWEDSWTAQALPGAMRIRMMFSKNIVFEKQIVIPRGISAKEIYEASKSPS